ncbi:type 1 glutamine amidotransferase [Bifidobacterium sp. ESL0763]|uniref:type 1 glutamine amidotransferase n=1 Tax=Bifidobacterium sp. ESL0763 TaxID=2983227 RepID=UPI0023F8183B|nr:type 1 glutamine amidotransferase [Bifidobacterium sp. ESL0763]MDF7664354.1 type 1 glutamine amidotransferase [Bifidobacterium sp. ESL0763]
MTTPKVLILQHVPCEKPGRILDSLDDLGMSTTTLSIAEQADPQLPERDEVAGIVIMGGPMGAQDFKEYPGLKVEAKLVRKAVKAGKPVLGICLGHQIIATALGATLESGACSEIGFGTIRQVARDDYFRMWSPKTHVLHWHNDVVSLPQGAQLLASSKHTANQAFRFKSALGLQFHLEVTPTLLDEWLAEPSMVEGMKKSEISRIRMDFQRYDAQLQPLAEQVFSGFAVRCENCARAILEAERC